MKVKIEFTLDVSEEDWMLNFGTHPSEVRQDIKDRAKHLVVSQFEIDGIEVR